MVRGGEDERGRGQTEAQKGPEEPHYGGTAWVWSPMHTSKLSRRSRRLTCCFSPYPSLKQGQLVRIMYGPLVGGEGVLNTPPGSERQHRSVSRPLVAEHGYRG
jgi:hypothetical protein